MLPHQWHNGWRFVSFMMYTLYISGAKFEDCTNVSGETF